MIQALGVYETLEILQNKLSNNKRVTYTRFGDGDLLLVDKPPNEYNTHIGSHMAIVEPKIQADIQHAMSIDDDNFMKAVAISYPLEDGMDDIDLAPDPNSVALTAIVEKYMPNEKVFYNPIVFHYLSIYDQQAFRGFFDKYVKPAKKMFIGRCKRETMEDLFGKIDHYVKAPDYNSYSEIDRFKKHIEDHVSDVDLILPTAGFTSRALAGYIWDIGFDGWTLDIGSVVDMLDGHDSRVWIKMAYDLQNKKS